MVEATTQIRMMITAFTSDDDDLDEDKDTKISHIARDIRKAID